MCDAPPPVHLLPRERARGRGREDGEITFVHPSCSTILFPWLQHPPSQHREGEREGESEDYICAPFLRYYTLSKTPTHPESTRYARDRTSVEEHKPTTCTCRLLKCVGLCVHFLVLMMTVLLFYIFFRNQKSLPSTRSHVRSIPLTLYCSGTLISFSILPLTLNK